MTGGVLSNGDEDIEISHIFVDIAIDILGGARRYGIDVGAVMVDAVIDHANMATESEKDALAELKIAPVDPPAPE